jgi:tetratricopeptide (TPR) repeat protein
MARADRRRAVREARRVDRRPRAVSGGARTVEDTMFFPKLRAHAKWVFILLAVVFATSFVFLGVGSGSSGIGDLLQGNWGSLFGGGSGTSAQISKDQKRIQQNPKDYAAYRDLASAQATNGKLDDAIATLEKLRALHPKDVAGLETLASLYVRKADAARAAAINAQTQSQGAVNPATFAPAGSLSLAKAYQKFTNPLASAISNQANQKFNTAYSNMTSTYGLAESAYKDLAKLKRNDPLTQVTLGQTAELAQDTKTAIAAYERFLKLAPDDSSASAVRQRIKLLKSQQQSQPTVSTG